MTQPEAYPIESPNQRPETVPEAGVPNWQGICELSSPEGVRKYLSALRQDLKTPDNQPIDRELSEIDRILASARRAGREEQTSDERQLCELAYSMEDDLKRTHGIERVRQVGRIRDQIDRAERTHMVTLEGPDARELLANLIGQAPNAGHTDRANLFLDIGFFEPVNRSQHQVGFDIFGQDPIDIPIGSIVSAEGLDSWYGRGLDESGRQVGKDGKPNGSQQAIAEFSSKPAETAPPVNQMLCYLMPDGSVYFKSYNSHRVAAAIRRGDTTIKFQGDMRVIAVDPGVELPKPDYETLSREHTRLSDSIRR